MIKIVLDPGHGGRDPGAVGSGLQEKDLTFDIALKTRDALRRYAANVYMTRDSDIDIEPAKRAELANRLGADYFLSIHTNAGGGTGFESYAHNYASGTSLALRGIIHERVSSFYSAAGFRDRGKKRADFAVLRWTEMPALLLENLFIDTAGDAAKLADPVFRQQIAGAIAAALVDALGLQLLSSDPVADAVQVLHKAGVIGTPQYWLERARPGKQVDGDYVGMLIQNMARKL